MNINSLKKSIRQKIHAHKDNKILYFRVIIHIIVFFLLSNYRKNRCLIDPPSDFFYKYKNLVNYFSIPLVIFASYLRRKKIFISINNGYNYSPGHIYTEILLAQKIQKLDNKYTGSTIWFTTSRKEILGETKHIFENEKFRVLFGGIKRIFLTFVALKEPSISIDGGVSDVNYFLGKSNSARITYHNLSKRRAKLISKCQDFFPNIDKLKNYQEHTKQLMQRLNVTKKYVVIQNKDKSVNGTLKLLAPDLLLKAIKYFQDKDYQIVFAGREKFPDDFLNKSIINYANSKYASSLNDFILIGNCSLVISSASGFCIIPESFDKPLLIINSHHIIQHFGRRTIYLPTLLSRNSKTFNARVQHRYLCTYGADCGYSAFDDFYILHMPTSEEIFMAAKELEEMLSSTIPPLTPLQKKTRDGGGCPLLSDGLSRISNYYLIKHGIFFEK
jgi:putative glycosyltransferase (TIGR04372 family)